MSDTNADKLRDFIRANSKSDGAMDALDALHAVEGALLDAGGARSREIAFSSALVQAQAEVNAAYKDKDVGDRYKVAETEQLLVLCREVMIRHKLALEVGSSEVVIIGGQGYIRINFGLRHESGFVRMVVRDFPLSAKAGAPDVALRQANTSALGYFLRDAFALPRLKDEGEAAAAQAQRSGPRKAATVTSTPAASMAEALGARIIKIADADQAEKARNHLDGLEFEVEKGSETRITKQEIAALRSQITARERSFS